jgi:hypothetical protein
MARQLAELLISKIYRAIRTLGGNAEPWTPSEASRAVRDLGADVDLRSIVDSWAGSHVGRRRDLADAEELERRACSVSDGLGVEGRELLIA